MAGLNGAVMPSEWSQLGAIAWLRGRLFLNAFRRKGGKAEVVGRVLLACFFAVFAVGPILGAGAGAYLIVSRNAFGYLPLMLWIVFFVWATFTISIQASGPAFDLGMLLRFPLRFRTYLLVRLLFGLLDVPTVVCSLALTAAMVGVGIARTALVPVAALVFGLYGLTILMFFRMIFLWLDRWFQQRKTREILMGCFFVAMLGFQYLNVTYNSGVESGRRRRDPVAAARREQRVNRVRRAVQAADPVLRLLPPGLAATSVRLYAAGERGRVVPPLIGLCGFAGAFLGLYGGRLRGEFAGESFSESAAAPSSSAAMPLIAKSAGSVAILAVATRSGGSEGSKGFFSPVTAGCIAKDLLYLRRSGPLLFALVTPVFMIFLLVTRMGVTGRPSEWVLPGAIAYILLGLTAGMYNILGTEGAGVQLYFLAPVSLREIVMAKNAMSLGIIAVEMGIATAVVLSTMPAPPLPTLCAVYVWAVLTIAVSLTAGNLRSIYAPRLVDLGKFRRGRQGQSNALIGLGVLAVCLALGAGVLFVAHHVGLPWLAAVVLGVFAAGAITFYRMNLDQLERIALERRETISAELCKV